MPGRGCASHIEFLGFGIGAIPSWCRRDGITCGMEDRDRSERSIVWHGCSAALHMHSCGDDLARFIRQFLKGASANDVYYLLKMLCALAFGSWWHLQACWWWWVMMTMNGITTRESHPYLELWIFIYLSHLPFTSFIPKKKKIPSSIKKVTFLSICFLKIK